MSAFLRREFLKMLNYDEDAELGVNHQKQESPKIERKQTEEEKIDFLKHRSNQKPVSHKSSQR